MTVVLIVNSKGGNASRLFEGRLVLISIYEGEAARLEGPNSSVSSAPRVIDRYKDLVLVIAFLGAIA